MNYIKLITVYALAILYIVVGITHFTNPDYFIPLVPSLFYLKELVIISGFVVVVMGGMLFFKRSRKLGPLLLLYYSSLYSRKHLFISFRHLEKYKYIEESSSFRLPFQAPLIIIAYWHQWRKVLNCFLIFAVLCYTNDYLFC